MHRTHFASYDVHKSPQKKDASASATVVLPNCREGDAIERAPSSKRASLGQEQGLRPASVALCPGDASHSKGASCSDEARGSNAAEANEEGEEAEEAVASSPLSTLTGGRPARCQCAAMSFMACIHWPQVFRAQDAAVGASMRL